MLRSRMGRRILAEQHLKLSEQPFNTQGPTGVLSSTIRAADAIKKCYNTARQVCEHNFAACPDLVVDGNVDALFSGVPYHAEYTIYELMKNAMVAVVGRFGQSLLFFFLKREREKKKRMNQNPILND